MDGKVSSSGSKNGSREVSEPGRFSVGATAAKTPVKRKRGEFSYIVELYETASRLYLRGVTDAFEMSPRQLVWFSYIQSESDRTELSSRAVAARAAQAEQNDFEKFMRGLS